MSSFRYGVHTNKHIGVWLKVSNLDVIKLIKDSKKKRFFDTIHRIIIHEYDKENDQVWLEVWCKNIIDSIKSKSRYNVFYIKTNINQNWSCEGDLGSGRYF